MKKEIISDKLKVHTRYETKDGTKVPGVTTILGLRAKPQLVKWANNLGLQGIDSSKYVDSKATIGTLAHYMVECHLTGEKPCFDEYSKNDISQAENSFIKYLDWEKKHKVELIASELQLVSEMYKFGGTIDIIAKVDGVLEIVDLKTAKAIYGEMFYQLSAYRRLAIEAGHDIESCRIIRIGRDDEEGFEDKSIKDLSVHEQIFMNLLSIYNLEKQLKKD